MGNDIICARCGKHLRNVEEARAHSCFIKDELPELQHEPFIPLPKMEMDRIKPPPPPQAPPTVRIEWPEQPEEKSNNGLTVFIIVLLIAFIILLAIVVWPYFAN